MSSPNNLPINGEDYSEFDDKNKETYKMPLNGLQEQALQCTHRNYKLGILPVYLSLIHI